jgi:DNA-binding transcriptional regulator YbjK
MRFETEERAATSAEGRRREILAAAVRIIGDGGPDAITHRRVAAEAGVGLGSLTYYFESRDDLVREAFRYYLQRSSELLIALETEIPPATPDDLVELIVEMTRREFMEPSMLRAEYEMILYAARDEAVSREFVAWERGLEARLGATFEALGASRPIAAARTIIEMVRGFELERLARPTDPIDDLQYRLSVVINALVGANGPARAAVDAVQIQIPKFARPRRGSREISRRIEPRRTNR